MYYGYCFTDLDVNPASWHVGGKGAWHVGTELSARTRGFADAVKEFAETLPEGEHIVGILQAASVVVAEEGTPTMRLARVVRERSDVVTSSIEDVAVLVLS